MTEVEAWVIDNLERLKRERQEDHREQLQLPYWAPDEALPEKPEPSPRTIVIEL